jgi:CPA2 family monovalent cation:H+ antiporter-2
VARWNSRELFILSTTALALGVGFVAWRFGLSLALGAFVAGLVINESEYAHQALSDVIPLRDLFGMLFFVSAGMLLDPGLVWSQLSTLSVVVCAVILGKAVILGVTVRIFGYHRIVPLAVALTLFQVGEFAFVLARVGVASGALSTDVYTLVLNTAIITMAVTPALSSLAPRIHGRFRREETSEAPRAINLPARGLSDHVVIAGAGRVGRSIADGLSFVQLPFVLIEYDERRFQQARTAGLAVIYGDAAQPVVLEAAGIGRAKVVLITVPAFPEVRDIVRVLRNVRPDLPTIARADSVEAVRALYRLGIEEVTSPEFEAAVEMAREALVHLGVPALDIRQVADAIRTKRYGRPRSDISES